KIAPNAFATGVSLDEVGAALATLTVNGIPMSEAATGVNRALIELNKGGSLVVKTFKQVSGQTFKEFIASGSTLQEALGLLKAHADSTGKSVNEFFGMQTAGSVALVLTGAGADYLTGSLDEMGNAAGSTERAFGIMSETNQKAMDRI